MHNLQSVKNYRAFYISSELTILLLNYNAKKTEELLQIFTN